MEFQFPLGVSTNHYILSGKKMELYGEFDTWKAQKTTWDEERFLVTCDKDEFYSAHVFTPTEEPAYDQSSTVKE